jgi:thiol-disulfide isomerase/thioredoxin
MGIGKGAFMKITMTLILIGVLAVQGLMGQTKEEAEALALQYSQLDYDITSKEPTMSYPDQTLYMLDGDVQLWVFERGNRVVITPEEHRIDFQEGNDTMAFSFANGLKAEVSRSSGEVDWGILLSEAPDFALKVYGEDRTITLSDLRGLVVLLDFYASWCGPCWTYMPETQKLHEEYADQGLVVLGVNIEGSEARAKEVVDGLGITFDTVMATAGSRGYNWGLKSWLTTGSIPYPGTS